MKLKNVEWLRQYYDQNQNSEDYNLKLNFFYGDEATQIMNFPSFGIPKNAGFDYAQYVAEQRKKS
ncbi:hypothetical protein [Portibacter marinus]|uniref:hypothetical protein n=1 Tax=Portibacter marinus TaxID=2898660 RepID=UPI001F1EA56F|nr:hypothetical protein [Portibacter marinus]